MSGRLSVIELPNHLNVGLGVIEDAVEVILKKDKTLTLINGQLIAGMYLERVCDEINDMLADRGQLFISELTTHFNLSIE